MIGLDTNVLVDLLVKSQSNHPKTVDWLSRADDALATTGINLGEVLRLLTHPRVFRSPLALRPAVDLVDEFLKEYDVAVLEEKEEWWLDMKDLENPSIRGNEVFDARIALCLKYNGVKEIATHDTDFTKYPFLKTVVF